MSNQAQLSDVEIAKARDVSILDVWARLDLPGVKPGKAFCSSFRKDKNPSCELGGAKNIFYDHTTKESLDSIALVRKVKNCSFQEAVAFILGKEALPPSNGRHPLDWGTFLGASTKKPVQVEPAPKPKFWSSLEVAAQECERLPLASADSAAVDFFMREYGLPVDCIPANWCVLVYHGQRGIVYPGVGPDGAVCGLQVQVPVPRCAWQASLRLPIRSGRRNPFPCTHGGRAAGYCRRRGERRSGMGGRFRRSCTTHRGRQNFQRLGFSLGE